VTAGHRGALLYVNGDRYEVRPRRAVEADPTGAGDVFAAAFLARYRRDGDPWEAAEAATCAASLSVEGVGWSTVPDAARLEGALEDYRRPAGGVGRWLPYRAHAVLRAPRGLGRARQGPGARRPDRGQHSAQPRPPRGRRHGRAPRAPDAPTEVRGRERSILIPCRKTSGIPGSCERGPR